MLSWRIFALRGARAKHENTSKGSYCRIFVFTPGSPRKCDIMHISHYYNVKHMNVKSYLFHWLILMTRDIDIVSKLLHGRHLDIVQTYNYMEQIIVIFIAVAVY
jgi:hypothetical protein